MFEERKPMTRHAIKRLESSKEFHPATDTVKPPQEIINLSSPVEKYTVSNPKKWKENVNEKT